MTSPRKNQRPRQILTLYLLLVSCILLADRLWQPLPAELQGALLFISDSDPIDAGRGSNSVYSMDADGRGIKRIVGSIPHGAGYLRVSDIACDNGSQSLVIASYQRDLNGFHHALLDGSGLHLDKPKTGEELTALRDIALASDGFRVIVAREEAGYSEPRFSLVAGDLANRDFTVIKRAAAERSYSAPVWSADGHEIAYIIRRHLPQATAYALAIAKPDGSDETVIHETALAITDIDWSPAGGWLALELSAQVYKIKHTGGELTRLSNHGGGAFGPRWSRDGMWISFVAPSSFPGFNQLMTMAADGGDIRQVANIHGAVVNGCWV